MIKNYQNTKQELEIITLRLQVIEEKKQYLKKEEDNLLTLLQSLQTYILKIEDHLKKLTGIEYKLYYQIVINGLNVTKAIDKVAFEEDKDVSTLWKNYYPKIKEKI